MAFEPNEITLNDDRRVLLRSAGPGDAEAHLTFMKRLQGSTPFVVTAPDEAMPVEKLREELATFHDRPGALYLVAFSAQEPSLIVGDCVLQPFKERKMSHVANIGMGCDERWQGAGLGTALLRSIVGHAEEHPALIRLELGVMRENQAARRLYRRLGFVEHGVRPGRFKNPGGGYSDEVTMGRLVKPTPIG